MLKSYWDAAQRTYSLLCSLLSNILHSFMYSFLMTHMSQASASRSQDEQYFGSQQALLQQQLADLRLRADKFGAEGREATDGLRKKRLKLQQDLEVLTCVCYSNAAGRAILLLRPLHAELFLRCCHLACLHQIKFSHHMADRLL